MPSVTLYKRWEQEDKILRDYLAEKQILFRQIKDKIWIDPSSVTRIRTRGYIWITAVQRIRKTIPGFKNYTFEKYEK